MKALVLKEFNKAWELMELPIPEPLDGQVLIKIHASGICGTDLHVSHGLFPLKLPVVCGHEAVGEIVKLGPGVEHLKINDRVGVVWHQKGCGTCSYCISQRDLYCTGLKNGPLTWMDLGGGHAEYMIAYENACTKIPSNLDYIHAAPLFCAGYTIASGYFNAQPKAHDTIVVLGMGGLGHLAVQYAKAKGHHVIAVTTHEDKTQLLLELGADHVLTAKDTLVSDLKKLGGADIILDCSSSNTLAEQTLKALKPEGRLILMGIDTKTLNVSSINLIHIQGKIIGSTQNHRSDLEDILSLTAQGKIKPQIEVFSLDQHQEALDKIKNNTIKFRAVFKVV